MRDPMYAGWRKQYEALTVQLAPYLILKNGEPTIDPDSLVPQQLAELYATLRQQGFEKGWLI